MKTAVVRDAVPADCAGMAELITQLGYPTTSGEMKTRMDAIFARPEYRTFVAENEGRIVGMLGVIVGHYYEKNGVYGRLATLVVDEAWRSKGVGTELVKRGEEWLVKKGVSAIIVNSGVHRTAARQFYQARGYNETGVRFVKLFE